MIPLGVPPSLACGVCRWFVRLAGLRNVSAIILRFYARERSRAELGFKEQGYGLQQQQRRRGGIVSHRSNSRAS